MLRGRIDRSDVACVEQIFIPVIVAGVCLQRSVILINHLLEIVVDVNVRLLLWLPLIPVALLRASVNAAARV